MFGMGPVAFLRLLQVHTTLRILLKAELKILKILVVARFQVFWSLDHFLRDLRIDLENYMLRL
jgi:hypothetical protein